MKKRLMIFCSLISLLLVGFQFPIFAEEDPSDSSSSVPVPNSIRLDANFYENYYLLPYVESDGRQYINTQIVDNNNLRIDMNGSGPMSETSGWLAYYGSYPGHSLRYSFNEGNLILSFSNNINGYQISLDEYSYIRTSFDKNEFYLNDELIYTFSDSEYSGYQLYIFGFNNGSNVGGLGSYRIYNYSIYDYDSESYVRYMYPAKVKSTGVIGMYDAINDVFYPSLGTAAFLDPSGDTTNLSIGAFVSSFLTSGLGWIGDIFEFAVETPIIMVFMAIGLAGAMFRWGRRLVHF